MLLPYFKKDQMEAGCDEAGRGCLAGPVYAAAVIFPESFRCEALNDSKQLSEKKRYELRTLIQNEALTWGVGVVECHEIDRINILNASFLAMHRALLQLQQKPEHLIVDGNRFRTLKQIPIGKLPNKMVEEKRFESYSETPYVCIVKGDGKYLSIAAASILAKTYRDDHMSQLDKLHPEYGWGANKGYPTEEHRKAIRDFGITIHHRKSFRLLDNQLSLDF